MNTDKDKNSVLEQTGKALVQMFKPKYNMLKNKAGMRVNMKEDGFIEDTRIQAADQLICDLCKNSKQTLEEQIKILTKLWNHIQELPDNEKRKEKTQEIFIIAHEIKDISSLCDYAIIAHFAESLRDYITEATMNIKNQRIIIQAHIDALSTILKNDISDEAHPIAEELKSKVKIAINKYR
ncbi:MAG: hypothetical protein KAJ40_00175 [Alphaproteobacteria bacterium]|nr:hypothetical protein [Alphaproteobacteria bacterium]